MVLLQSEQLPMGWPAPEFNLLSVDGKQYKLADFQDKPGLLLVFTCNHCPYAKAAWPELMKLYGKFSKQVNFAAINANDAMKFPADSYDAMKVYANQVKLQFPYLRDESQAVAKAYGARCTPDPYLFKNNNGKFELFYRGRINDNWQQPEKVTEKNLEDALERLVKGESPPENQPPSMGCSIKWLD